MALGSGIGLRRLSETWGEGFPTFHETSGVSIADAAALAFQLGLVPLSWHLTETRLVELATERRTASTVFARRWGVSRWTVTDWRRALGLERLAPPHRRPARPARTEVGGVEVTATGRLRLYGPAGSIRLGRAARAVLEALVEHHPEPVCGAELRARVFPDEPDDQARSALHSTVWRLRRHLPDGSLARSGDGYLLAISADAIRRG